MTCQHCTFCEEERANVVRKLYLVETTFYYCTLHDRYVERTHFCDNFTLETPDVTTTQSERKQP